MTSQLPHEAEQWASKALARHSAKTAAPLKEPLSLLKFQQLTWPPKNTTNGQDRTKFDTMEHSHSVTCIQKHLMSCKPLVVSKFIDEAVNISLEHIAFTTQTSQDRTAVPEMFPSPGQNDW